MQMVGLVAYAALILQLWKIQKAVSNESRGMLFFTWRFIITKLIQSKKTFG